MEESARPVSPHNDDVQLPVFEHMAATLRQHAWCVLPDALPLALRDELRAQLQQPDALGMRAAGIGRLQGHTVAPGIRSDAIAWITGSTPAERAWLAWADALRQFLNRHLFLGLDSFESHFAHYAPGAFYARHLDAFRTEVVPAASTRRVSLLAYLNPLWRAEDGGELVLFDPQTGQEQRVLPELGTVALFLSEEVPHEVRAARRDRYSIAGWFRVRTGSTSF
jgi:SM-20-related protein